MQSLEVLILQELTDLKSEGSRFMTSQSEGGEDVLLAGRALVGRGRAEVRLPIRADVVVLFVIVQGVEQRGRAALPPGPHRNLVRALGRTLGPLLVRSLT